jgi:ABC-type cobalamin/Fe3+-siderophores transport system ATPase subunit
MLLRVDLQSAGYPGKNILSDIRFELPEGRILALIGPNGCGKTTLIRAISGVLPDMQGEIHINGTNLVAASQDERARLVAVVPQSTHIPPSFLVEDVVRMGRTPFIDWMGRTSDIDESITFEAMEKTDVVQFAGRYCGELSAGERQRVTLARALTQDTPVLLMDEPTSHLDLRYQIDFLELTMKLAAESGKTVMVALHDLNLAARFGDEVLAMKVGQIAAKGKTAEVLKPEIIEQIYGLEVEIFQTPGKRRILISPL